MRQCFLQAIVTVECRRFPSSEREEGKLAATQDNAPGFCGHAAVFPEEVYCGTSSSEHVPQY